MNPESQYQAINGPTNRNYPQALLHRLIDDVCQRRPDEIAVLAGDRSQTFRELREKSDALGNYLTSLGIGPGALVGLCCDRNLDLPAMLVGILKSGAGYVPLDPDYPVDRLSYMADNSEITHLIAGLNQAALASRLGVPATIVDRDWDQVAATVPSSKSPPSPPISGAAYVIYTSGSTGRPKGVVVPHRAVVNLLWSMMERPGFTEKDRILATTTLSFDISVIEMFLPLVTGGSVAVVDRETAKDTPRLLAAMDYFRVNCMQATPAMWRMIVEADFVSRPGMKFITAGEPLPRDLIRPMLDRCDQLWNLYGPTETTVYSTGTQVVSDKGRILIGTPIANTEVYVVDDQDNLCPAETEGELLIAGDGVADGYLKRPDLNAEKFISWNGTQVYRTGDLARLTHDGQIEHLGRIDNQIKFNGHRIELGEIDSALAMQPGVLRAATVLREDRPGDKRLVGYLLPKKDESPCVSEIRSNVADCLPDYMVPNSIVVVDEFKYTPSGKLDRKAFDPPSTLRPDLDVDYVAPRSEDERRIAAIWSDLLQIDRIGTQDNFLELGGNSIRAVTLAARLEKEAGIAIAPGEIFDNPTIASIAKLAERKFRLREKLAAPGQADPSRSGPFAIIGMAARMPGACNLEQFWDNLISGRESIRFFDKQELDSSLDPRDTSSPSYVPARGIIDEADHFDAKFFGIPPRHAELTDPQQRILLELAWSALEDAGVIPSQTRSTIGIWAGSYSTTYYTKNILTNPQRVREVGEFNVGVFNEKDYIATRVAHALNLTGPAINVNTACSTSLVALIQACRSLEGGDCDVAIAGGVSVTFPQHSGHLHQEGSIFSPDGHCRPFDSNAAGTVFSDGAGVVVVKRVEDAIADGDRIYAVVKGFGINNDGGDKASFSAPSIQGQAEAIAMAHARAGIEPETISYVEAHGTATPLGDPIEVSALQAVFGARSEKTQYCAIGSVKSNIGHTVAAAGVAGLIKVALAMHTEQIPATLHYQDQNPQINFRDSPFYVCDSLSPWTRGDRPRRAGVSSFGVGGTNAHVILEEAPATDSDPNDPNDLVSTNRLPLEILPISAKSEQSLLTSIDQLASALQHHDSLAPIASTLQTRREHFPHRAVLVADSVRDAASELHANSSPRIVKRKAGGTARELVFLFPGQGAQYVRMGQNLYEHSSVFRSGLDRCAEDLAPLLGRDLREVLFPRVGDERAAQEILKNTRFTQPALFSLGYSLAQVWQAWGFRPSAMIGHSIGEFVAACLSGVFTLEDGLKMIAERGRLMQSLPGGSMMSVRMPGEELASRLFGELAIASYNGPNLCVVAGTDPQVAELQQRLESRSVVCKHLHTSHAFHSPMMEPIVEPFAEFVRQIDLKPPSTPILSTVTGAWMTDEEATDPNYWANHLLAPVRFSDAVHRLWNSEAGDPDRVLIELGPRRTLATLAKQHAKDPKRQVAVSSLSDNAENLAEWHAILNGVAQLWLCGVDVDWSQLSSDGATRAACPHASLPTYAFERKRFFIEPGRPIASNPDRPVAPTVADRPNPSPSEPPATSDPISTASNPPESKAGVAVSRIPNLVSSIHSIFEDTSGIDLGEFDGDTTFFEMGLDSLVLTQTASALQREMETEVTFRQLMEQTATVDSLAAWLDERLPADRFRPEAVHPVSDANNGAADASDGKDAPPTSARPADAFETASVAPGHTHLGVQPSAPANSGAIQEIVHIQLQAQIQLMQQQLQALSGGTSAIQAAATEKATPPAETTRTRQEASGRRNGQDDVGRPGSPAPAESATESADVGMAPKSKRFKTVKLDNDQLSPAQRETLGQIVRMSNAMLPESKAFAQRHRRYLADPRTVSGFRPDMKEMTHPIVVERSKGVHLWDIDGNEYIDFTCGFGSNFLGHTHDIIVEAISEQVRRDFSIGPQSPLAGEVAKLFCEITGNERMAFSNTGSEAVLGCTRLARNYTGRDLIVMFNDDYHGILDEVIVRGSKKLKSFPAATGIPKDHVNNTLILDYGTDESLAIIRENLDRLAGVLVEPVQSRRPELQPGAFLQELGRLTADQPTALIFDEVITGLRIGLGGAQEHFGVRADLASYGKIVGGGMPIGVVAGKAKYMDGFDGGYWSFGDESRPEAGMTYFAGTFVRHPLTLAASRAILLHLRQAGAAAYDRVNRLGDYLAEALNRVFADLDAPLTLAHFGSLFKIQFREELVYSEVFFSGLRRRGMHIWDHRPCLLTLAHETEHVDALADAVRDTIVECQRHGFMPGEGAARELEATASGPPLKGAKMGTDESGNPGWFIPDAMNPGQYLQVGLTLD